MGDRVLVVSNDAHVSPPLEHYRPYCPTAYRDDFEECIATAPAVLAKYVEDWEPYVAPEPERAIQDRAEQDPTIHFDPNTALRHMDADGVAAQVLFHGSMNNQPIPFLWTGGIGAGTPGNDSPRARELAAVGMRMYNRWLADYCSAAPERFIGLAQIPMWDVDLAVREVEFAHDIGLRGINFPAPRRGLPDYNELVWDPFWSAAEARGMPLNTHGASTPVIWDIASYAGVDGWACMLLDTIAFSRRAVHFMILGGVFDRHPDLKLVLTEQPSEWVEAMLHDLDSMWGFFRHVPATQHRPSHYFHSNCFVGCSFMSNGEARSALEQDIVDNVLWGSDYPHIEGVWPYTRLSLRTALVGIPDDGIRKLVGENAVRVYGLDRERLAGLAERIGPTLTELKTEPGPGEVPDEARMSLAFRTAGSWA